MIPLTVRAHLSTPAALEWPLMLDALLLGGLGAEMGAADESGWADGTEVEAQPLPLARVEADGLWWYACSQITPEGPQAKDYVNRVPLVEEYARLTDRGSVNVASGPDKRMRRPIYYRPGMCDLTWTAVGDLQRVAELLARVSSIGKLRGHGWGWVRAWSVAPGGPDLAAYRHRVDLRHLPADGAHPRCEGRVTRRGLVLRPPYWRRVGQVDCWQQVAG